MICRPETKVHIKRMEAEKKRKLQGDTEDNRSFFAKYVSNYLSTHSIYFSCLTYRYTACTYMYIFTVVLLYTYMDMFTVHLPYYACLKLMSESAWTQIGWSC